MSTDLVVPATEDIARSLPSAALYELEQAGQIAATILDERVIEWTEEGWTQRQIAEELNCSQPAVSKRQARLGVQSRDPRGGSRFDNRVIKDPDEGEEVEPDEVLPPDPEPPVRHLPDEFAPDAEENLRTVSLRWFQLGRDIKRLLEEGGEPEARSREDKQAIKDQADLMIKVARTLKGAL